jgi:diphosphomevalonate decarboxylase
VTLISNDGYGILHSMKRKATALAHPNIAFIKYWGLKDFKERIPANGSISMNLGCLSTRTTVHLDPSLHQDRLVLNGKPLLGAPLRRVQGFMDRIRALARQTLFAHIISENNFPAGAGVASSASAFAALALASSTAMGLDLREDKLSGLAKFGSGSACRSIPGGFVAWDVTTEEGRSFARSFAPAEHWQLVDCIAILSTKHKETGSEKGMQRADTSPLQSARVADSQRRFDICQQAILHKDFEALAKVTELDSNLMHAVMMTSDPPLFYWQPESLGLMKAIQSWQKEGLPVTYTLDAGPNVHVICLKNAMDETLKRLRQQPGIINILKGLPAGPARLVDNHLHFQPPAV